MRYPDDERGMMEEGLIEREEKKSEEEEAQ